MAELFYRMKNAVLGKSYSLSVVFVVKKEIQKWNCIYRKHDEPTDVLSFALRKNEGEIIFCEEIARKKAKAFLRVSATHISFLFIHAMLHLIGIRHGSKMEHEEARFQKKFRI